MSDSHINDSRRAGVLLHPTSLPSFLPLGDIGHQAWRFIEFLHEYGFKTWQMLPLGPTLFDKSPYQCLSAHAANPDLISLDWLQDRGWLDRSKVVVGVNDSDYRRFCLEQAGHYFYQNQHQIESVYFDKLADFSHQHKYWLDDYALFMALKEKFDQNPWYQWPQDYRYRQPERLQQAREDLQQPINQIIFEQFVFFTQWQEIRDYAHQYGIEIFGDMPIFMARDSADVWAYRQNFLVDQDGNQAFVAGVPPDAFSKTGQRWGNPLYDWEFMQADDFSWWKKRIKTQLQLFDMIRIDHFRGLQACWYIPASDETAANGFWQPVPGKALLQSLFSAFSELPLIAEDLGVITDEVLALKNAFDLPGMKVLQFAFDGNNNNPHLLHRHKKHDVIYTGTHDNDTTLGWLQSGQYHYDFLKNYTGCGSDQHQALFDAMLHQLLSSPAFLAILPMQDLLMLDGTARMNTPGTMENNWLWKFEWQQVNHEHMAYLRYLLSVFQR